MYRYIERVNYAENSRDADNIHYHNERYFNTLEEAKEYAKKKYELYFEIKKELYKKNVDFVYDKQRKEWLFVCIGSWAPTLCIKECIIEKEL